MSLCKQCVAHSRENSGLSVGETCEKCGYRRLE